MRTRPGWLIPIATACVGGLFVVGGCGGGSKHSAATTTAVTSVAQTTTKATHPGDSSDRCARAGEIVNRYDILAPGASRKGYLILLHTLQRDCPKEAVKRGLDSQFLPRCHRLNQENCTMYRK